MKRNRAVHLLSLGTMVACLLILGAFLILFGNLSNWVGQWGSTLSMSIYLKDGVSDYKRDKIDAFIRALPGARIRRFISKEDAIEELKAALGEEGGFLERLTHNPLPASYEVVFETADSNRMDTEEIKARLLGLDGVADVQHSRQWVKRLEGFLHIVRLVGTVIGGLLCLCVVFMVTNAIKLTIYSRRDEIEILKLVGATDWFVKLPFLLEGAVLGFFGGGLTILALFLGYLGLCSKKIYLLGPTPLEFVFLPGQYVAVFVSVSMVLGIVGSFIAIGRFIEV
ncbi:MAG: ABC transporter permease [Deltaproteobacteria bacterium]|nr:ABC transporter permease [Deltaproteobacteria bacterium]